MSGLRWDRMGWGGRGRFGVSGLDGDGMGWGELECGEMGCGEMAAGNGMKHLFAECGLGWAGRTESWWGLAAMGYLGAEQGFHEDVDIVLKDSGLEVDEVLDAHAQLHPSHRLREVRLLVEPGRQPGLQDGSAFGGGRVVNVKPWRANDADEGGDREVGRREAREVA